MAICKDCFHWESCRAMFEAAGGIIVPDDFKGSAVRCKHFVSTADVVPRAAVAKEIFEELDKKIFNHIPDLHTFEIYTDLKKKYTQPETEPPNMKGCKE